MLVPENNVIELRAFYTWMGEDGIARTKAKKNAEVVLEDSIENSKAVNSLGNNVKYALVIDSSEIKSITKDARSYFSMHGRNSNVVCFAIIISSPVSAVIGNFFMGLNKPRVPAKLFSNEKDAVMWCQNQYKAILAHD